MVVVVEHQLQLPTWVIVQVVWESTHLHERESHEVLLAILKKKKCKSFGDDSVREPKRAKFVPTENTGSHDGDTADISQAKELSQSSTHAFLMLADIVKSDHFPPNNPPNPNSVTDTITVDEAECFRDELENEEMPPLEDIDD